MDGIGGVQKKPLVEATPTPVELQRTLSICTEKVWMGRRNEGRLRHSWLKNYTQKRKLLDVWDGS